MTPGEIDTIFRDEAGRALATLIRLVGDFDLAEDVLQEAFAVALERWPAAETPSNPRAWLVNVGRNKAIDRIRRQIAFRGKQEELTRELQLGAAAAEDDGEAGLDDDMLRLIFTCCHPAFAPEVQVALTLRTICGLTTAQVARAFLVTEEAMGQRLVRAKQKIRLAGIPYEVPDRDALAPRLNGVLAVIYLVFTEGYVATSGAELMRPDLAREAIRLGRLLDALMPQRREVKGLLALMLLHDARRAGRASAGGDIVLLEEQDRTLWDKSQIAEGLKSRRRGVAAAGTARGLCGTGGDRSTSCARAELRRHRLEADRRPLRSAAAHQPVAGDRAQPRGGDLDGRWSCACSRPDRRNAARAADSTATSCFPRSAPICCGGSAGIKPLARPILRPLLQPNWSRCAGFTRDGWPSSIGASMAPDRFAAPVMTINAARYFAATTAASEGKLPSSDCSVISVEWSATPSTRAGRKWRWKAATTSMVAVSYFPLVEIP